MIFKMSIDSLQNVLLPIVRRGPISPLRRQGGFGSLQYWPATTLVVDHVPTDPRNGMGACVLCQKARELVALTTQIGTGTMAYRTGETNGRSTLEISA